MKAEALDYVEVEVRELKLSFEAREKELEKNVAAANAQLTQLRQELSTVKAAVEAAEREKREEAGKAAQAQAQLLRVEAEMRQLLQEMARRQQLANQLAQTLSM